MEPRSQTEVVKDCETTLHSQIRELYGRVVYSHKIHEKQADILMAKLSRIKLGQIVLPAISTGGFVTVFLDADWLGRIDVAWLGASIGAIFSALLLVLNLYTRNYDLADEARLHKHAAINILSIREKYFSLLVDMAGGCESPSEIRRKRDALADELNEVYSKCPITTEKAYKKAQKALKSQEEMTFADAELDVLLPPALRNKQ